MNNNLKKFVVLEHLLLPNSGKRFWSTNTENNTHLYDGTLAYKEILFTDSEDEAINASRYIPPHMETKQHKVLNFLYNRLIEVHGENPNYDYMINMKEIIDNS